MNGRCQAVAGAIAVSAALFASVRPATGAEFVAPYVNAVQEDVRLMLDLAELRPGDRLIDLGAGDGRIVIEAAQRGIPARGIELDPDLVALARERAEAAGVSDLATFEEGDIFAADLSDATVVTLYLMPDANLALRPKLLRELLPGTRILSLSFTMGDWQPDARAQGRTSGGVLLWRVPANVAGRWQLTVANRHYALRLAQNFQQLHAELTRDGMVLPVQAVLEGAELVLTFEDAGVSLTLHGRVGAGLIEPATPDGHGPAWQALRAPDD